MTQEPRFPFLACLAFGLLAISGAASVESRAAPALPVVYQDANVLVRAGIAEAGSKAIHLGDAFSFTVQVEFDAGSVRVETPDDEWFQRAIAAVPGLRLYESVAIAREAPAGEGIRITSRWRLQALDCPAEQLSCAGSKTYELPVMTINYQLTGAAGSGVDGRSARFRPWPGELSIVPSIPAAPGPDTALTDLLPGGAHAPGIDAGEASGAVAWLLPAAALLLLLGFVPPPRTTHHERAVRRAHHTQTRWEQDLLRLDADPLDGEQWADLARRAVAWYCVDELGVNPFTWLGPAGHETVPEDSTTADWREFFLETLEQHEVAEDRRRAFLDRFRSLVGEQPTTS